MKRTFMAALMASAALAACAAEEEAPAETVAQETEAAPEAAAAEASPLDAAVANPARSAENVARDVHRHPAETLEFFGLQPGMTVVEINPGGGAYYAEILAKYANDTGGAYIGTGSKSDRLADAAMYGEPTFVEFGMDSGPLVEPGTADMVLTFRNVHNWYWQEGMLDKAMSDFAAALKPGGTLGVTDHRADPRAEIEVGGRMAGDAYMAKASIVEAAERAGLVLDGESEINANPADTKDHPFGVWTLPPFARTSPFGEDPDPEFDRTKYDAIGESDRHTLRFKKPA